MGTVLAALIALCGVIIAAYINNFLAEDYKRHKHRVTLAASLAGELGSHSLAFPIFRRTLFLLLEAAKEGKTLEFPKGMSAPSDPIYEHAVTQLGVLGAELTQDVVFVYQNIRAARMSFFGICNSEKEPTNNLVVGALTSSLISLDRAVDKSEMLLQALTNTSKENYELRRGSFRLEVMSFRKSEWNKDR